MNPPLKASARRPKALADGSDHSPKPWQRGSRRKEITEMVLRKLCFLCLLQKKIMHNRYEKTSDIGLREVES